ncbi:uncharacterized protein WM294_014375 [Sarcoramphus papa]
MWTRGVRNGACVCGGEEAPWGVRARIAPCSSGCVSAFCKVELQQRKGSTPPATPEIPSPEKSPMGLTPAWWRKRSHTKVGVSGKTSNWGALLCLESREQVPQAAAAVAELFFCPSCTSQGIITIHDPVADTALSDQRRRTSACRRPAVDISCTKLCAEGLPRGYSSCSKSQYLPWAAETSLSELASGSKHVGFFFAGESFQHVTLVQSFCEIWTVKDFTRDFPKGPKLIPAISFAAWGDQALGCFNLGIWANHLKTLPVLGAACVSGIAAVHGKEVEARSLLPTDGWGRAKLIKRFSKMLSARPNVSVTANDEDAWSAVSESLGLQLGLCLMNNEGRVWPSLGWQFSKVRV